MIRRSKAKEDSRMNRRAATIDQALRDLSPRQCQEIVPEALAVALEDMPNEGRQS